MRRRRLLRFRKSDPADRAGWLRFSGIHSAAQRSRGVHIPASYRISLADLLSRNHSLAGLASIASRGVRPGAKCGDPLWSPLHWAATSICNLILLGSDSCQFPCAEVGSTCERSSGGNFPLSRSLPFQNLKGERNLTCNLRRETRPHLRLFSARGKPDATCKGLMPGSACPGLRVWP
jgi:hypothetical protein